MNMVLNLVEKYLVQAVSKSKKAVLLLINWERFLQYLFRGNSEYVFDKVCLLIIAALVTY